MHTDKIYILSVLSVLICNVSVTVSFSEAPFFSEIEKILKTTHSPESFIFEVL